MTNVLPPEDRQRMWIFFRMRFIRAGSFGLIIVALIALVTVAPSYILLIINKPVQTADGVVSKADTSDDKAQAQRAQALITDLYPLLGATSSPVEMIGKVLSARPEGILVSHVAYSERDGTPTIILGGVTKARGQAEELRKALENMGLFQSVAIPVSDLVGANGNQFTVTLTMKKPS